MRIDPSVKQFLEDPTHYHLEIEHGSLKAIAGVAHKALELSSQELQELYQAAEKDPLAKQVIPLVTDQEKARREADGRVETAKTAAAQNGWEISCHIKEYGITDQAALIEIAKIAAAQSGSGVSSHIKKYGITDEAALIEIAKIAVAHSGLDGLDASGYIQNYGITDQAALIEIARIAASESAISVLNKALVAYQITDQTIFLEIARLAAAQSPDVLSVQMNAYLQAFRVTDQAGLAEVAKIAAAQHGEKTSEFIQNYGITNQTALIEIAKLAATQNGLRTSGYIKNYGITDQNGLIEIAKIAADQNGNGISESIQNYKITNQTALVEIAKIAAAHSGYRTSEYIQNYKITAEAALIEIAKIAAAQNGDGTSNYIGNYEITDQRALIEIAKIAAAHNEQHISHHIKKYGITNKPALIEIAKIAAFHNGESTSRDIGNYGITDQAALIEIAKIAAAENPTSTSNAFLNYKIEDEKERIVIAKIAAAHDGEGISRYASGMSQAIQNYKITDETALIEIAKIVAAQSGHDISQSIESYNITDQNVLIDIAKIAAADNGGKTSENIPRYEIKDPAALIEIAKIAAIQDAEGTSKYLYHYKIKGEAATLLKMLCAAHLRSLLLEPNHTLEKLIKDIGVSVSKNLDNLPPDSSLSKLLAASRKTASDLFSPQALIAAYCLEELGSYDPKLLEDMTTILRYPNAPVAFQLAARFVKIAKNADSLAFYRASVAENPYLALPLILLQDVAKDSPKKEAFLKTLLEALTSHRKAFKDAKSNLLSSLLNTALVLNKPVLSPDEQMVILEGLCQKGYSLPELLKGFRIAQTLCGLKLGISNLPENSDSLEKLQSHLISHITTIFSLKTPIDRMTEKYLALQETMRIPGSLELYASRITDLYVKAAMSRFITSVLEGKFKEERYGTDNNAHLRHLQEKNPAILAKWKESSSLPALLLETEKAKSVKINIAALLKQKFVDDRHLRFIAEGEEKCALLIDFLKKKPKEQKVIKAEILEKIEALEEGEIKEMQRLCIQLCNPELTEEEQKSLLQTLKKTMDKTPFFRSAEAYRDIEAIELLLSPPKKAEEGLRAMVSDDWQDLFLSGTEVIGSCQNIHSGFNTNKCLLAYAVDGKNLLVAVKDPSGKVMSRSIVRLLIDKITGNPAVFQERIYPNPCPENQVKALNEMAQNLATHLGIPLMATETTLPLEEAEHPLASLGSSAPFEYSDAGHGVTTGEFTIEKAKKVV